MSTNLIFLNKILGNIFTLKWKTKYFNGTTPIWQNKKYTYITALNK